MQRITSVALLQTENPLEPQYYGERKLSRKEDILTSERGTPIVPDYGEDVLRTIIGEFLKLSMGFWRRRKDDFWIRNGSKTYARRGSCRKRFSCHDHQFCFRNHCNRDSGNGQSGFIPRGRKSPGWFSRDFMEPSSSKGSQCCVQTGVPNASADRVTKEETDLNGFLENMLCYPA